MTKFATASLAILAAAALSAPALGKSPHRSYPESGQKLTASLSGAMEVPGPGDSVGAGTFSARVNPGTGQLCYTLTASKIGMATMAHIHEGVSGVAGSPVVTLAVPTAGSVHRCLTLTKDLAMKLAHDPAGYYVNVHNAKFPYGAIRGQVM